MQGENNPSKRPEVRMLLSRIFRGCHRKPRSEKSNKKTSETSQHKGTSKNLLIELFSYHHTQAVTGVPDEQHVWERVEFLRSVGYETLVIWEAEFQDAPALLEKIRIFQGE